MRKQMLALCVVLVFGAGLAQAQIPAAAYRDLGRPAYPCCDEEPIERWWISMEYLIWWMSPQKIYVPLVTTGTTGISGAEDTGVLFPTGDLSYGGFSGTRLSAGGWWNCERTFGLEVTGFYFESRTVTNSFASDVAGNPSLFVPFTDGTTGTGAAVTLADPNTGQVGNVNIFTSSHLWGAESNVLLNWSRQCGFEVDFYFGLRYVDLLESLNLAYSTTVTNPLDASTTTSTMADNFATRNQFYGGQLGTKIGWYPGRSSFEVIGKVALGNMHSVIDISGQNANFNTTGNTSGGIFTQPSNIVRQSQDNFAVVPQLQLKVGFELFPNVHVGAGYDFLYLSYVMRPGLLIDNTVVLNQPAGTAVGSTHPLPAFNGTDFYAHGLSFSLEYKY